MSTPRPTTQNRPGHLTDGRHTAHRTRHLTPAGTDPDKYKAVFENDRVRVLEYRDTPGARTRPHRHPDSVMYTLSGFQRRLHGAGGARDMVMEPGRVHWLPAQTHAGENIGITGTHVLFVELKS
jgi:quercetin dioxygenase-like cupin family protein